MLAISANTRVFIHCGFIDFRKGIDGMVGVCRYVIEKDPFSGTFFVFRNRKKTTLRILSYDGQGFWLCTKRLSQGFFHWWPSSAEEAAKLRPCDLLTLIWNGNPCRANFSDNWRKCS